MNILCIVKAYEFDLILDIFKHYLAAQSGCPVSTYPIVLSQGVKNVFGHGFGQMQLVLTQGIAVVNHDHHVFAPWSDRRHIHIPTGRES